VIRFHNNNRDEGWTSRAFTVLQVYCLLTLAVFATSAVGQRRPARPTTNSTQSTNADGLAPAARNSLDAAVAALQSNALAEAERDARAAVSAAPRSAITHNVLGVVLVALGIVMSIPGVPGQGILTILLGIMLLDFPGKRDLEHKLVSRPPVFKAINKLRHKFGKPALMLE